MAEWGATPDGGCPELEDLPSVPGIPMSAITGITSARDPERLWAREEALQAREAEWVRNVPAEQCRCLKQTIVNVRSAADRLVEPGRFEEELAELAEFDGGGAPAGGSHGARVR